MMPLQVGSPFKTPEFRELFDHWNQILEQDGLKEIEDFTLPEPALHSWHNLKWRKLDPEIIPEVRRYYRLADQLLRRYPFKHTIHKRIWELHCQGMSIRQIAHQINQKKFTKTRIHVFIVNVEIETGLKRV